MGEPKLILKVELKDNKLGITFGTRHEALLSLAIRKCELQLYDVMLQNEMPEPSIITQDIPDSIIKSL